MASAFDDMVAEDNSGFFGLFGEKERVPVVHASEPRTVLAIVLRETRRPVEVGDINNLYNAMDIYVSSQDDSDGIVSPRESKNGQVEDVFTIDGKSWSCQRVLERDIGGMHKLELWDGGS